MSLAILLVASIALWTATFATSRRQETARSTTPDPTTDDLPSS